MDYKQFHGVHTALVTPMASDKVCFDSLERLIDHQLEAGIDGLVIIGTTAESPTLTTEEQNDIIRLAIQKANGQTPVMVGTGSNCTKTAIKKVKNADKLGANAHLQVAPSYNKPNQEGLYRHFSAIADATETPIMLYSIPSRCGIEISVKTTARLRRKYPHIIGIKEAGGCANRASELRGALDDDFVIVSGDDALTLPFMSVGAQGIISVAANLIPREVIEMVRFAQKNDFASAQKYHIRLAALFKNQFVEPNPVPIKYALWITEIIKNPEIRLPLCPLSEDNQLLIKNILKELDIRAHATA